MVNQFDYTPRCHISAAPYRVTLSMRLFCVAHSSPSCANMTSSIKPEVINVSQRRERRTEPHKKFVQDWMCSSIDVLADRHPKTDTLIKLCSPTAVIWTLHTAKLINVIYKVLSPEARSRPVGGAESARRPVDGVMAAVIEYEAEDATAAVAARLPVELHARPRRHHHAQRRRRRRSCQPHNQTNCRRSSTATANDWEAEEN